MKRFINKIILIIVLLLIIGVYFFGKYPIAYVDTIKMKSEKYGVDPYLIASIINVESHYRKNALSNKEAKGLMQITPNTGHWASEMIGIADYEDEKLYEVDTNIEIGAWYIDKLLGQFDNNVEVALAAYNGGSGNVEKWLEDSNYTDDGVNLKYIPFEETRNYVEKVKKSYRIYSRLYKFKFDS